MFKNRSDKFLKTKHYYPAPTSEKKEAVAEFVFTPQMKKEAIERINAAHLIKEEVTTHTSIYGKIFQNLRIADPRIAASPECLQITYLKQKNNLALLNSTQQVQSGGTTVGNEINSLREASPLRIQQAQCGGSAARNEAIPLREASPLRVQQAQCGGSAARNEAIPLPETSRMLDNKDFIGQFEFTPLMKDKAMAQINLASDKGIRIDEKNIIDILKTGSQYPSLNMTQEIIVKSFIKDSLKSSNDRINLRLGSYREDKLEVAALSLNEQARYAVAGGQNGQLSIKDTGLLKLLAREWRTNIDVSVDTFVIYLDITSSLAQQSEVLTYLSTQQSIALAVGYKLYLVSHWSLTNQGSFLLLLQEAKSIVTVTPFFQSIPDRIYQNRIPIGISAVSAIAYATPYKFIWGVLIKTIRPDIPPTWVESLGNVLTAENANTLLQRMLEWSV